MEQRDYWADFLASGKVQDYLQYAAQKKNDTTAKIEVRWHGIENQGIDHPRADDTGE